MLRVNILLILDDSKYAKEVENKVIVQNEWLDKISFEDRRRGT